MMAIRNYTYTFVFLYVCFIFHTISADEVCDKSKCKGPIGYYNDLNCTAIYNSEDDCCAVRYNCDHLEGRSKDKCYFKGHVYDIGEELRAEDAKPCDIGCTCSEGWKDAPASFSCAAVDCFGEAEPGCYLKEAHGECCDGPEVCLGYPVQNDTGIPRCEVDGKTYLDGQRFTPSSSPNLSCICGPGYTGENVEPFCKQPKPFTCDSELHFSTDIYSNCTPAFYSTQNPATDCHFFSRCQNNDDRVMKSEDVGKAEVTPVSDPDLECIFGQLRMKVGDQLNQATHYSSVCVKCVCEVPPTPTCQRLTDAECDVTVHPKFDDFSK